MNNDKFITPSKEDLRIALQYKSISMHIPRT